MINNVSNAISTVFQILLDISSIKGKAIIYREEIIQVIYTENIEKNNLILKRVSYKDENNRNYAFISNNLEINSSEIALIYKKRWEIKLLFKKMKQNFQLSYFYGENENAIRTQVWCTLIAQMLPTVLQKQAKVKKAFSTVATLIRIHLVSLLDVIELIQNTKRAWKTQTSKVIATI